VGNLIFSKTEVTHLTSLCQIRNPGGSNQRDLIVRLGTLGQHLIPSAESEQTLGQQNLAVAASEVTENACEQEARKTTTAARTLVGVAQAEAVELCGCCQMNNYKPNFRQTPVCHS